MKPILTLAMLTIISGAGMNAQKPIKVSEDSLKFGKSTFPGLSVNIPEVGYENTLKVWIKDLESGSKSKVIKDNDELTIFGARIKDISGNPVNVYSKLISIDSMLHLTVSFELTKDKYIDRVGTPSEYAKAQTYIKQFAKNQYIEITKVRADAEEKKVREIERELSTLEKEKARMQKSIVSNNTTITKENDNIGIQKNELTTVETALVEHNKQLDTMSTGPAKEEKVKYIKELEKRKKNALSAIESSQNKINRTNNDTDKLNADIPKNEEMQAQVRTKLDKQQTVYQEFADKIKTIRSY
jgi:hypothetical protein